MHDTTLAPRISPVPAARRGLLARLTTWFARRRFGRVPAPLVIYAHSTPLLAAVAGFELAAERAHAVDARLKALVDLKVAALVSCPYCLDIGSLLGRHKGVTERQIRELATYATSDAFTMLERLALDLATAMTQAPVQVSDALFAALRAQLGEGGVVELCGAIAWENFRARMNHALGIAPDGFSDGAACALPEAALGAPPQSPAAAATIRERAASV